MNTIVWPKPQTSYEPVVIFGSYNCVSLFRLMLGDEQKIFLCGYAMTWNDSYVVHQLGPLKIDKPPLSYFPRIRALLWRASF